MRRPCGILVTDSMRGSEELTVYFDIIDAHRIRLSPKPKVVKVKMQVPVSI